MVDLKEVKENVVNGKVDKVKELTQKALDEGQSVGKILNEALIAGMDIVGEKYKKNEFYIPEMLVAARAMKAGMEVLRPILTDKKVRSSGKVVLGTVQGDLHDIGKNLVGMMLEGAGFEVIDLGTDVSSEKFVETVKENNAQLVGMSALLTTTMIHMKDVIKAMEKTGLRGKVKIMVGGAPVTQDYADEIGADGYAPDAVSAVDKVKEILKI
ncbi:cobalamin-binding protein [Candidatus Aerophobetes bacterium]|uniref:Cobalamin-binding protein n=1 Tax=Aerophobetes bacterium TaxID=2030807 RepID=A0A497E3F8_UNCAE|nr:MAG: cobalamin-binding protein [Candidatus Aerophobetes bacterium]